MKHGTTPSADEPSSKRQKTTDERAQSQLTEIINQAFNFGASFSESVDALNTFFSNNETKDIDFNEAIALLPFSESYNIDKINTLLNILFSKLDFQQFNWNMKIYVPEEIPLFLLLFIQEEKDTLSTSFAFELLRNPDKYDIDWGFIATLNFENIPAIMFIERFLIRSNHLPLAFNLLLQPEVTDKINISQMIGDKSLLEILNTKACSLVLPLLLVSKKWPNDVITVHAKKHFTEIAENLAHFYNIKEDFPKELLGLIRFQYIASVLHQLETFPAIIHHDIKIDETYHPLISRAIEIGHFHHAIDSKIVTVADFALSNWQIKLTALLTALEFVDHQPILDVYKNEDKLKSSALRRVRNALQEMRDKKEIPLFLTHHQRKAISDNIGRSNSLIKDDIKAQVNNSLQK